jgi:prepilin-type N-terminal cleavage/methylation domain-containing protein
MIYKGKNKIKEKIDITLSKLNKMMAGFFSGFTLVELIVVVIILGILAGTIAPQYNRGREKSFDKQAQIILSLIRAAQKTYQTENGYYYTPGATDVPSINSNLSLRLANDGSWNYGISDTNGFVASAQRDSVGYDRTWVINPSTQNATCTGDCP